MKTGLYRHYDQSGILLYVGISNDPMQRMRSHRSTTSWAHAVTRTEVIWFDKRADARVAEMRAIDAEKPLHNAPDVVRKPVQRQVTRLSEFISAQSNSSIGVWASRFGVSRPYVYQLLDGTRSPSLAVATRISVATHGAVPVTSWPKLAEVVEAAA